MVRFQLTSIESMLHEYKTPISVIRGNADIIRRYHERGEIDKIDALGMLSTITRLCDQVGKSMTDNMTLSRIESVGLERRETADIDSFICQICEFARQQFLHKGVTIDYKAAKQPILISADFYLIEILLVNLISNGIKYSEGNAQITVSVKEDGDDAIIAVKDCGIGIPKGTGSKIYDRYERLGVHNHDIPGSGIGLHMVKTIIDAHKGKITYRSGNQGTTFCVRIPKETGRMMSLASYTSISINKDLIADELGKLRPDLSVG